MMRASRASAQGGKIVMTLRKAVFYFSVLVKASLDLAVLSERVVREMVKSFLTTSLEFFSFSASLKHDSVTDG